MVNIQPINNHELFVRAWGWFMVNPTKGKESVTNSPSASYCLLLAELPESFKTPDEKPTASTAWEETHGTWGTVQNLKPKQESFFAHTDRPLRSLLGFFNFHVTSTWESQGRLRCTDTGVANKFFPSCIAFWNSHQIWNFQHQMPSFQQHWHAHFFFNLQHTASSLLGSSFCM